MTEYGITGLALDVRATLRTADDKRLSDLTVVVDGRDVGFVTRMRVNRPRKDGAGVASALRWCCFSRGWAPPGIEDLFGAEVKDGYPIGEGFDDRMEAAIALLEVWDREGRPT